MISFTDILKQSSSIRDLSLMPVSIVGVYFLWLKTKSLQSSSDAALRQANIVSMDKHYEHMGKAIEELESDQLATRIYSLHKFAQLSKKEENKDVVIDILSGYIRSNWPWDSESSECKQLSVKEILSKLPADRRMALHIIGNTERNFNETMQHIELHMIDLSYEGLGHFPNFFQCDFGLSNFFRADLTNSNFAYSYFTKTDLTKAKCCKTNFQNADFKDAKLNETDFSGADLSNAKNLTQDQLAQAITDSETVLPDYLKKEVSKVE